MERALLEAGAIKLTTGADGEDAYTRINGSLLSQTLDGLANDVKGLGLEGGALKKTEVAQEYLVSAPGKVILFGEHAVVHGVVCSSFLSITVMTKINTKRRLDDRRQ